MPNQPKTPKRTFRIPDEIYVPAREKAQRQGDSLTDIVREALVEYVKEYDDL